VSSSSRSLTFHFLFAISLSGVLGCSGGGQSSPPGPPPNPVTIFTLSLPDGIQNQSYSQVLLASGGTGTLSWRVSSGSPPAGMNLSAAGVLSGTPTASGIFNFTVQVTDSSNPPQSATQPLALRIAAPLVISTTVLPAGSTSVFYNQQLAATGGTGSITWSGSPRPPGGLLLTSTGLLFGFPFLAGNQPMNVTATDAGIPQQSVTQLVQFSVAPGPVSVATTLLPSGTVNVPYNIQILAVGGQQNFTWSLQSGALPGGLEFLAPPALIIGTPSVVGSFNFTLLATDSSGASASRSFTLDILASQPRNDSIAAATPLLNGIARASISPLDNPLGTLAPDNDFYRLTAPGGAVVLVEVFPQNSAVFLDPVIEILDSSGARLSSCRAPGSSSDFTASCMNDDVEIGNLGSQLFLRVPPGPTLTFFLRVLDFRGDARPDFVYDMFVRGAN